VPFSTPGECDGQRALARHPPGAGKSRPGKGCRSLAAALTGPGKVRSEREKSLARGERACPPQVDKPWEWAA